MAGVTPQLLPATTLATDHQGTVPLLVAGLVLLVAAAVVRRVIRLALLVALAGAVAVALAAWRSGAFGG